MYRSRLKERLSDRVLSYLSSINEDESIFYYDIIGSEAHVIMLYEQGLLDKDDLKAILDALEYAKHNGLQGINMNEYEDIHEAIEAFVVKRAGMMHGGKMHTARSRNDQVALDLRMKVRDDIISIAKELLSLVDSLLVRAKEHKYAVMPMYTHMQQAQIGTLAHYFTAYASMLIRDYERLESCYARVNQSPLGATAVGGTSLNIDRVRVASLLAFDSVIDNSIDATSSRDFLLEYLFVLSSIMLNLSRMAEDFIIWSSSEFSYIELPDELASTSSIMPQKKNPCPLELIRARASSMLGLLFACMGIVKSLPSGYSRDMQESKRLMIDAYKLVYDSLYIMGSVVNGLKANVVNMLRVSEQSYALALDVAEGLVKQGIPFRFAHKIVGMLVAYASKNSKTLKDLNREEISTIVNELARDYSIDSIDSLINMLVALKDISPMESIMLRASLGSPNPLEQDRMIKVIEDKKATYYARISKMQERLEEAISSLGKIVTEIIHS
jgi:argininosuccinate lyase